MILIKSNDKVYENCFESIKFSGSIKTSTRVLDVTYVKDKATFLLGQEIEFIVDNEIVFVGEIYSITKSASDNIYSLIAMDKTFRLNKNKFIKNYFNTAPSVIVKSVLAEIGLEAGEIPEDATKCTFTKIDNSGFDIIMSAYKLQSAQLKLNGLNTVYSILCRNRKINVIEQGILIPDVILSSKTNIIDAVYSENILNMVNKIILYKQDDNKIDIVHTSLKEEDVKKFGVFQIVHKLESGEDGDEGLNESLIDAVNKFKGVSNIANLKCIGNHRLMAGYSVQVDIAGLEDVNGVFYIESDSHEWVNGDYTTSLKLNFENIMTDVEIGKTKKAEKLEDYKNDFFNVGVD